VPSIIVVANTKTEGRDDQLAFRLKGRMSASDDMLAGGTASLADLMEGDATARRPTPCDRHGMAPRVLGRRRRGTLFSAASPSTCP
jgi:hypothetical protein